MNKTVNDVVREVSEGEGECGCEPRVFACSENHAKLMAEGEGER